MAGCCNGTKADDPNSSCLPCGILLCIISPLLVLSLSWNIFCCVSKCCSGKRTCRSKQRQSRSSQQMEDNPIYGNLNCIQTNIDPPFSSLRSISVRDQQRVNSDPESKPQDCYANLTLKAPRPQSGRSSPQIQYSVVQLEEPKKEDEENTDTFSNVSDLYASVQTQRTKTIDTANCGEGYANHI